MFDTNASSVTTERQQREATVHIQSTAGMLPCKRKSPVVTTSNINTLAGCTFLSGSLATFACIQVMRQPAASGAADLVPAEQRSKRRDEGGRTTLFRERRL